MATTFASGRPNPNNVKGYRNSRTTHPKKKARRQRALARHEARLEAGPMTTRPKGKKDEQPQVFTERMERLIQSTQKNL